MGVVNSENEGKAMDASEEFSSNRSYAEVDSHSSLMVPIERITELLGTCLRLLTQMAVD